MTRLAVPKTYKLYIGGAFPRSESGRTYEVRAADGDFLANAAKASRKDARDAIVADKLRAGVIWANTFNRFDPSSPFGGYKESGYGREGGRHGLAAYLKGASK